MGTAWSVYNSDHLAEKAWTGYKELSSIGIWGSDYRFFSHMKWSFQWS